MAIVSWGCQKPPCMGSTHRSSDSWLRFYPHHSTETKSRKEKPVPFPINQNFKRKPKAHFPNSHLVPAITHSYLHLLMTECEKVSIQGRNHTEEWGIF